MSQVLWLDLETGSESSLDNGVYRYAEDAFIRLCAYAWNDDEPGVAEWDEDVRSSIEMAVAIADVVMFHNAEFDSTLLGKHGVTVPLSKQYCTMAQARRHGLPGGLAKLCEIFKVPEDEAKLKDGRKVMLLFCRPQKDGTWATQETHPVEWARYLKYATSDITAMRAVHRKCPQWNDAHELPVWRLDQRINARGFAVDRELAHNAVELLRDNKEELDEEMQEATFGAVTAGTQRTALLNYIFDELGIALPDLTKSTIERRLADETIPDAVKDLLKIRLESAKASTAKYSALLRCVNHDGRLRGCFVYSGAYRTLRWAATKFQAHNLPSRFAAWLTKEEIDYGIRALKSRFVEGLEGPLSSYASAALRGCVVAPPGSRLLVADLKNIEGRLAAWFADEEWKLQAFRLFDLGVGPDIYHLSYERAFGVKLETITYLQRQIGKVIELMLAYGGGVGAFLTGAAGYGIDLAAMAEAVWPTIPPDVKLEAQMFFWRCYEDDKTFGLTELEFCACDALKRLWRRANANIVQLWYELEDAARHVIVTGGVVRVRKVRFDKVGAWMRIQLPSGLYLSYPAAAVDRKGDLTYLGNSPYTRSWGRQKTWGGTLLENICQAATRELLAEGLTEAERRGGHPTMHEHDSGTLEERYGAWSVDDFIDCLTYERDWTEGLPLSADGFETERLRKN